MPKRINTTDLRREIAALNKQKETLEYRIRELKGNTRYYSGDLYYDQNQRQYFISSFMAFIQLSEKKPTAVKDRYTYQNGFERMCQAKIAKNPVRPDGVKINKWDIERELDSKITTWRNLETEKLNLLNKEIAERVAKINAAKGRKNKLHVGMSFRDKILEGSEEKVRDLRYCSSTGREIIPDFSMIKKVQERNSYGRDYYNTDRKEPVTFMDIGIAKMAGFLFYSNFKKQEYGMRDAYRANPKTNLGVLKEAVKANASDEIKEAAQYLKNRMGDNIFFKYLDTGNTGSGKTSEFFLLDLPARVNKQSFRCKFRGKERLHKIRQYKKTLDANGIAYDNNTIEKGRIVP